jgi:hypothetical protein
MLVLFLRFTNHIGHLEVYPKTHNNELLQYSRGVSQESSLIQYQHLLGTIHQHHTSSAQWACCIHVLQDFSSIVMFWMCV